MEIKITEQKAELAVAYREHATPETMMAVIDKGLNLAFSHLKEQGIEPAGAPFCLYTDLSEGFKEFDLVLGFPVAEEIPLGAELRMTKTYGGKAVEAMHKGAYSKIEKTYEDMMRYVRENSLEMTGDYYEWYLNDPDETPEDELLTRVVFPIKKILEEMKCN